MARIKIVAAVTALMVGATGAGILTGTVLVVGGLAAWTALRPVEAQATPGPVVEVVAVRGEPAAAPVVAAPAVAAPVVAAPIVAAPAPAKASPTRAASTTTTRAPKASSGTMTRGGKGTASAAPADDLLADEDEWESLGFDEAPDVAPSTPDAEEVPDDEDIDAILEDLDADSGKRRRR